MYQTVLLMNAEERRRRTTEAEEVKMAMLEAKSRIKKEVGTDKDQDMRAQESLERQESSRKTIATMSRQRKQDLAGVKLAKAKAQAHADSNADTKLSLVVDYDGLHPVPPPPINWEVR
jgi:hypothetical protein